MAREDDYKGYRVTVSASPSGTYSPAEFLITRKRGEHGELVYTGKIEGTFSSPQHAFRAAYEAARAWIDEHGQQ